MSTRGIVSIGDPVLRERAREVDPVELRSPEFEELIADLIDTKRAAHGAGIAANQVGVPLRIAVAEVTQPNPRYPYKPPIPLTVIINPQIELLDEELVEINEGCLSVPGLRGVVSRHVSIRIRYLDRAGNKREDVKRGLTAGTFQHEVDHLDGKLFVDRADPRTLMSWEQFDRFHRDEFVARMAEFAKRVGS